MSKDFNISVDINAAIHEHTLLVRGLKPGTEIIRLAGEIEVIDPVTRVFVDIFEIEIYYPEQFPKCFPVVIETGGKIPRSLARHVMPKSDNLCLAVKLEEIIVCKHGISTLWFLNNVLIPRLAEEYRVSKGGKYKKEYSHDLGGTWEFLMQKLDTKDPEVVLTFTKALSMRQLPKRNQLCLCDGGREYGQCHRPAVVYLQQLGHDILSRLHLVLREEAYNGTNLNMDHANQTG